MTLEKEKRLKELESKQKLVYKGTGKTFEVLTGPGGVETWTDGDRYEWAGTEAEGIEYGALLKESFKERVSRATGTFERTLASMLYGRGFDAYIKSKETNH